MRSLRARPLDSLGGEPVLVRHDFLVDGTDGPLTEGERAARDVLELSSEHYRIVVRPSGTEAKLKYYFDYREGPLAKDPAGNPNAGGAIAAAEASRFAQLEPVVRAHCSAVYADLARRAGYELSDAALELPDVLPVQDKVGR